MKRLDTESDLAAAVDRLSPVEPRFAPVVERHGLPPLRHGEAGLGEPSAHRDRPADFAQGR